MISEIIQIINEEYGFLTPFKVDNFNKYGINDLDKEILRKKLFKLLPQEYQHYIERIINSTKIFKGIEIEKALIFVKNKEYQFHKGEKYYINIPKEFQKLGERDGFDLAIHYHIDGTFTPSLEDIELILRTKTKISMIFSPVNCGIIYNDKVIHNQENKNKIIEEYSQALKILNNYIGKKSYKKIKEIDRNCKTTKSRKKAMETLVKNYHLKNPEEVVKVINNELKEFNIKIYKL